MNWQILIFISLSVYAVAIILQRLLMRDEKSDSVAYSIFFQGFTGLLILIFALFTTGITFPPLKPLIVNLILMTLLYGFANIFGFKALKLIEASEFTILFATRALFTLLASSLLLREGLNLYQFIGAFLILLAVVLVTIKSTKFRLKKGELFALAAALCFGLTNTNDRYLLGYFEVYSYVILAYFLPAIFTAVIYPKSVIKMKIFLKSTYLVKMLVMCILYAVSSIAFFTALQIGNNSSIVVIINLLSVILIVILSAIFLRERSHIVRKILGAVLSIIGSAILIK